MSEYLIGIDGGASRSLAILVQPPDRLVAEAHGGGLNPLSLGWKKFKENLSLLFADLTRSISLREIRGVCAGLAGTGQEASRQRAQEDISLLLLANTKIFVISDALAALWGAFQGDPGLLLIAGTGSICLGMDDQGKTARSGGFGRILGDEGSGYWIAVEAMRRALAHTDQGRPPNGITSLICDEYGLKNILEIVSYVYSEEIAPDQIARLADRILALSESDADARRVVADAAEHLAALVMNTSKKLHLEAPKVALWGGLWNSRGEPLQIQLKAVLARKRFKAEIQSPKAPPHWGAIYYLKKLLA